MQRSGLAAEAYLDHVAKATSLTEHGKHWLTQAIDPFHDLSFEPSGYPDVKIAPSVSQCIKQTFTIKKPAALPVGNWDLHLFNVPWWTPEPFFNHYVNGNVISLYDNGTPAIQLGGIVALAGEEGTALWTDAGPATGSVVQSYGLDPDYFRGSTRVTGAGFEAVNTTSKLNIQGQVIVYRQPQPSFQPKHMGIWDLIADGEILYKGGASYTDVRPPPYTTADAMLFTGSKQWQAAEGAYCVISFNDLQLPADGESVIDPIMWGDEPAGDQQVQREALVPQFHDSVVYRPGVGPGYMNGIASPRLTCLAPQDMSGMYFSGLSAETTISLSYNVYLERFPGDDDRDLKSLAQPSPPYDVFAQQLYTYCLRTMPPGVPAYMNGLGDWFASTVSKVAGAVKKVAGMIPHPIAQAVSQGAGVISGTAELFENPPNTRINATAIRKEEQRRESIGYATSAAIEIPKRGISTSSGRDRQQDNEIRKLRRREDALEAQLQNFKQRMASSSSKPRGKGSKRR